MQLMVAGHATSADTMTWCVYILATRPDIQDRLRAELSDLLARDLKLTYNDINSCAYMEAFIKEALRIYAPCEYHLAPFRISRRCYKQTKADPPPPFISHLPPPRGHARRGH